MPWLQARSTADAGEERRRQVQVVLLLLLENQEEPVLEELETASRKGIVQSRPKEKGKKSPNLSTSSKSLRHDVIYYIYIYCISCGYCNPVQPLLPSPWQCAGWACTYGPHRFAKNRMLAIAKAIFKLNFGYILLLAFPYYNISCHISIVTVSSLTMLCPLSPAHRNWGFVRQSQTLRPNGKSMNASFVIMMAQTSQKWRRMRNGATRTHAMQSMAEDLEQYVRVLVLAI